MRNCGSLRTPEILPALALFACGLTGRAQSRGPYDLSSSTIDGGGTSSGGAYAVGDTIGQPDAGQLAGGGYTLSGGFWGVVAAIPTEGAPLLTVSRSGPNVVVKWPFPSTGFVLQQTSALASPPSAILWADVTSPALTLRLTRGIFS